jgi:hypothetical protein
MPELERGVMTVEKCLVLSCTYCGRLILAIPDLGIMFAQDGEIYDAKGVTVLCGCSC